MMVTVASILILMGCIPSPAEGSPLFNSSSDVDKSFYAEVISNGSNHLACGAVFVGPRALFVPTECFHFAAESKRPILFLSFMKLKQTNTGV